MKDPLDILQSVVLKFFCQDKSLLTVRDAIIGASCLRKAFWLSAV